MTNKRWNLFVRNMSYKSRAENLYQKVKRMLLMA
uniref:Uncharacterized protein n=1 Tax=Rhizophora mucronata TaxID=61149 RepID=A0A2P2PAH1_RHIMU